MGGLIPTPNAQSMTDILDALLKAAENPDQETSHAELDALLCQFLVNLGFPDIVAAYLSSEKWFA